MTPKDTSAGKDELFEARPRERVERSRRLVRDDEGLVWRIREVTFADTTPSLVFEAEGVFRRVRRYPTNWYELTDEQLYELSWRT